MTEYEIKIRAFEFVERLQIIEKLPPSKTKPVLKGSLGHLQSVDLTDKVVVGPVIQTQQISELGDDKIEISIDAKTYGFSLEDYPLFYKFIYELSHFNNLHLKVSIKYLRIKTLLWIIDIYINNYAKQDLLNYLFDKFESEVKKTKYYYPILNLTIEEPFKIGHAKITYFTKEYFDKYWENSKEKPDADEKGFNSLFRKYQGRVFIETVVNAESKKGEEMSYELAAFAADIITLLSPTIVHPQEPCLIDLEKRLAWESEFLSMDFGKDYDFKISISANQRPFHISTEMVASIENNMLRLFGKILQKELRFEIDSLVVDTIKLTSKAIREIDLHLRISLLIMVIESIFLLEMEEHKMDKKCKRRMCQLLNPNGGKKHQSLYDTLSNMYEIRHKMTHKSIRLYIEPKLLSHFQINLVEVILQLLSNNERIRTKENLIKILDQKVKTN